MKLKPEEIKAGMKVMLPNYENMKFVRVTARGEDFYLGKPQLQDGTELSEHRYCLNSPVELYEEPKKVKLVAPALMRYKGERTWFPSANTYSSFEEASRSFEGEYDIIWPAIPNKDGFYEVPE